MLFRRIALGGGIATAMMIAFAIGSDSVLQNTLHEPIVEKVNISPARAALPKSADAIRLRADTPVIGVTVGNRHRAYVLSALIPIRLHVLNDMIGETPVAVTYCDRTDCVKAFTAAQTAPLEIAVGGWKKANDGASMLLRIGDHRYEQRNGLPLDASSPAFPYTEIEVEQTNWSEWLSEHPNTEVVTGGV